MDVMKRVASIVLIALSLAPGVLPAASASGPDLGERLRAADAVRTSDPKRFGELLAELDRQKGRASPGELQYLRLLHDYQKALSGDYGAALGDAVALHDQASNLDIKYRAALLVANVAVFTRDFGLTLRYLERALQLEEQVKNPELQYFASTVASTVYNEYGKYDLARRYAQQVLAGNAPARFRCISRQNLVEALYQLGEPLEQSADLQAAVSECVEQRELIPATYIRSVLAKRWAAAGKVRQAVGLLEATLPDAEASRYTRLIGEMHGLLAKYRLELGDVAGAERHARAVTEMQGQDARWLPGITAYHVLYRVALGRGDFRSALDAYRHYADAEMARLDDVKAREYAFQLSRHELRQKNQSIALLSKRNEVLKLEQEVAKQSAQNTRLIVALLVLVIAWAAVWIIRAKRLQRSLRDLAETDGLTGLANRRHFRARSEALLAECRQKRQAVSILLFDLDHFKQINDQCGHSAGDWVLREVARIGRLHCRSADLYGRIGGEEFAITLVDCDLDVALRVAEECRRAIARINAAPGGCTLPVSASIGCVGTSVSGYDYERLIAHADAAMYRAKVAGRNRVCLYEPSVPRPPGGSAHAPRGDDTLLQV